MTETAAEIKDIKRLFETGAHFAQVKSVDTLNEAVYTWCFRPHRDY